MTLWRQAVRELRSDRRKLAAVVVLCAFGMLLWGRLLLKDVPRSATARPAAAAVASAGVGEGRGGAEPAPSYRPLPVVHVDLPRGLPGDPFDRYGRTIFTQIPTTPTKSGPETTDEPLRPTAPTVGELRLEGVLIGPRCGVVLNGYVLELGEAWDGFRLVSVADRQAVLEHAGSRIRLSM